MAKRYSFSIVTILLAGFCGLSAIGIGVALYLGLSAAVQNTSDLLTANIDAFFGRMTADVQGRLRPIERRSELIADRIKEGRVAIRLPFSEADDSFFRTMLETTPGASAISVITKDGEILGWRRGDAEVVIQDSSQNVDVMARLRSSDTRSDAGWGPPVWVASLKSIAIEYRTPLFGPQGYIGYLSYVLPILDLSLSLTRIDENAFILFGENQVLAHPLLINWRPLEEAAPSSGDFTYDGGEAFISLDQLGDPILANIWDSEEIGLDLGNDAPDKDFRAGLSSMGNREFAYFYKTIDGYGVKPWTIGTYVDANKEDEVIDRMAAAAVTGGIVLLLAVGLGLYVACAINQPIQALARASAIVESGRLGDVPPLPHGQVSELNIAMSSFEGMVRGLQEKELIRRTLGCYVPETVAEQLLKTDGLEPVEVEATILFSDIVGFTSLTEELGPSRIVEVLNAYFSRMTEIIEAENGVISQFQGDAILAIFKVPIEAPDHAECAYRTAVKMRQSVAFETFAGQSVESRIGINTGSVVAGAVGAEGRLTYTVHGDAVNLAARVEAMNKETGTTILVTEATAQRAPSLRLKDVGRMTVRGQTEAVTVFTTIE